MADLFSSGAKSFISANGRRSATLRLASASRNVAEAEREQRAAKPEEPQDLDDERGPCLLCAGSSPHPNTQFFLSAERPEGEARSKYFKFFSFNFR